MTVTEGKAKEMLEAAKPLMKWMAQNCHPHCTATVDCASVDLAECVANEATDEFLGEPCSVVCPTCGEKDALSVGPSVASCRVCMHSWELPKDRHASDCATHNGPAFKEGPCDCGVDSVSSSTETRGWLIEKNPGDETPLLEGEALGVKDFDGESVFLWGPFSEALRFARKEDAEALARVAGVTGHGLVCAGAVEHLWYAEEPR